MQNLVELMKDHALILAATQNLSTIAQAAEPRMEDAFVALRRLSRLLDMHLRAEDEFLNVDLQHGRAEFTALAAEHGERFGDLVEEWALYLREWSEENIRRDWKNFGRATDWIVTRLNAQVMAEDEALYPAALRYGLIRLVPDKKHVSA